METKFGEKTNSFAGTERSRAARNQPMTAAAQDFAHLQARVSFRSLYFEAIVLSRLTRARSVS
jgi:hypothetical protein